MIPENWQKLGVIGRSGAGKSSLMREVFEFEPRVVMFDPLGNTEGRGWSRFSGQLGPLKNHIGKSGTKLKALYEPARGVDAAKALNQISKMLFDAQIGYFQKRHKSTILLAVEEITKSYPLHGESKCPWFTEICDRGRHYGIRVVAASQSPARIAITYREAMDAAVVMATMTKAGQQAGANMVDVDWKQIRDLPNYRYYSYHNGVVSEGATKKYKK